MKLVILCGSDKGAAGYFVQQVQEHSGCSIAMVIANDHSGPKPGRSRKRRLKKVLKIGILGALNGIRMRKWFGPQMHRYLPQVDLKQYCQSRGIRLEYTPATNHARTRELFLEAEAEVGISLGNDYISSKVFSLPRYGMINLHGEILPDYQNAQSVIWQIHNGSPYTGYTIHKISSKIDQGEILFQERMDIEWRASLGDTVAYNCARITEYSAAGLVKVLSNFPEYFSKARPQGGGGHYTTPTIWQYLRMKRNFKKLAFQ